MSKKDDGLKEFRREQNRVHKNMVNEKIEKVDLDLERKVDYKLARSFRWFDALIILMVCILCLGFSFLIGILALNSVKKVSWVSFAIAMFGILIFVALGFVRNRMAVNFYGDRRMRYRKTLTTTEGTIQRFKWISAACSVILIICTIIIYYA